jgi:hypothetical protein
MSKKVEMLTISELRERKLTDLVPRRIRELITGGYIKGWRKAGKTYLIPTTEENLAMLKRHGQGESRSPNN